MANSLNVRTPAFSITQIIRCSVFLYKIDVGDRRDQVVRHPTFVRTIDYRYLSALAATNHRSRVVFSLGFLCATSAFSAVNLGRKQPNPETASTPTLRREVELTPCPGLVDFIFMDRRA